MSHLKSLFFYMYTSINGWAPYELLISERNRKTDKAGFIRAYISAWSYWKFASPCHSLEEASQIRKRYTYF